MRYKINSYGIHHIGQRDNQEDSLFPGIGMNQPWDRLFIVCDGIGGHESGEVASRCVCDSISEYILANCPDPEGDFTDDDLRASLNYAYDRLDSLYCGKDDSSKKMGTTLTFLKLHNNGCTIAHIGDSRIYHVRPGSDSNSTKILHQTYDHSLINDLIRIGELTPEEAKHSKQRNVITRAIQPKMDYRSKPEIHHITDIVAGDYFMLCSDGILEQMGDDDIKMIFCDESGDIIRKGELIEKLTELNRDNHTAYLIEILEVSNDVSNDKYLPKSDVFTEKKIEKDTIEATINPPEKSDTNFTYKHTKQLLFCVLILLLAVFGVVKVVHYYSKGMQEAIPPVVNSVSMEYINGLNVHWGIKVTDEQKVVLRKLIHNMVSVDGGTFMMGAAIDDSEAWDAERPAHNVTLSDYRIGKYEVTQREWIAVMGNNPSAFKDDDFPVEQVSWNDCNAFIQKLNSMTGLAFRLPTEAEWEYAARGGNRSIGYKYSGSNKIDRVACYTDEYKGEAYPVGSKQPNELGLYDMSGNVWEWCANWYYIYPSSSETNPKGPAIGSFRMCRGGSRAYSAMYSSVSFRIYNAPSDIFNDLGFRIAM